MTKAAIGQFQKVVLNFRNPDETVEPEKRTWKALNSNVRASQDLHAGARLRKTEMENAAWCLDTTVNASFMSIANTYYDEMNGVCHSEPSPWMNTIPKQTQQNVIAFRQGDRRWGKEKLGYSKKGTIHGFGCAMTSLTMAATYIGSPTQHWDKDQAPKNLTPLVVNNIFKKAGVYKADTYMLFIVLGAKALGMNGTDSGVGKKINSTALLKIDQTLSKGGLVLAHVDYKKSWKGDHWILLTQKLNNSAYRAIDPAYGKTLSLHKSPDKHIKPVDYAVLYGRSNSFEVKTPSNVSHYKVVRYVLLTGQQMN